MSKGGAGKVYFVLYLAVILELLIIIVERDEAEEHLMKKQQESMRIVESILTQLQSGAGTEGINTRPQDAIVISDNLPDEQKKLFKKFRTYYIEVGVTDVSSALNMDGMDAAQKKEKAETLKKLANVQELQYEIYYNPSKELNAPDSPPLSEFKKVEQSPQEGMTLANSPNSTATDSWQLLATRKIDLDIKGMKDYQEPIYIDSPKKAGDINKYAPQDSASVNRVFGYSEEKTNKLKQNTKLTKRAFVCNFQPDGREGWYKLRFSSQTNRILGISAEQNINALKDDQKVNIGTVQLKVKDLRSVQRQLADQLSGKGIPSINAFSNPSYSIEKFNDELEAAKTKVKTDGGEKVAQDISRIDLFGYIAKLLTPGKYTSFDQNRGSIEIDIFVQKPEIEEGQPVVTWDKPVLYSFDRAKKYTAILEMSMFDKLEPKVVFSGGTVRPTKLQATDLNGKKGKWKFEYFGSLAPGKYTFTASLKSGKNEDVQKAELRVYRTGLAIFEPLEGETEPNDLEKNLDSYIKGLEKGEDIEFNVIPSSGDTIPPGEFRIIMNGVQQGAGEPSQKTLVGLRVTPNTNWKVPIESQNIGLKVVWVDPNDANSAPVQIFPTDGADFCSGEPNLPKPRISLKSNPSIQIGNPKKPRFDVTFRISSPLPEIPLSDVKISIASQNFGKKNNSIRVEKISESNNSGEYTVSFALVNKSGLPLSKGTSGTVMLLVSAKMNAGGTNSNREKDFPITIFY
jgi:hypothetical protein